MSWHYRAPVRDMNFVMQHVLQAPMHWSACPAFADVDAETAAAVLNEAARFASDVLQPTNAAGDTQACTLRDGRVQTPPGFKQAYSAYVSAGWPSLTCAPEWGGQGLPLLLDAAAREMLDACNHAWNMYPGLLHGAYETIRGHGSDYLKAQYLTGLVSGDVLAAMALTEPDAGSDLGRIRTKAIEQPDGRVRVTGQKIFISGGDHDLTANIVHLVLCRLPDAPAGSKGLSLVLVPKVLPDGTHNAMHCDGIEHKMGIHGSASCAMRYESAWGWLVGEPHRGLAAMFLMMNSARLHVGLQGLGHQEMATQNALRYAMERVQMGTVIANQPAVRHTLLGLQAHTEGMRVLAYRAALAIDLADAHPDPVIRLREKQFAALLTPVVKAACTRQGFASSSDAMQVFGGYGYVREYGVEQTLRDSRIAMLYEGTNEIQAIDLVQRKLIADDGRAFFALLADFDAEAHACNCSAALAPFGAALADEIVAARRGCQALLELNSADREAALTLAPDVMLGLTYTMLTWAWCRSARCAEPAADRAWADAKVSRMRYGIDWLRPAAAVHWHRVAMRCPALPFLTPDPG